MARYNHRPPERAPLTLRWRTPDNPLPICVIRATRPTSEPAWHQAGMSGFVRRKDVGTLDFSARIQRLVIDIASRCGDFKHIDTPRILVSVARSRGKSLYGLQARVTPLRFPNGTLTWQRRGVPYQIQRFFLEEREFLYLMTFCLPRYLEQEFEQKLATLFHELYHISPAFDGDLRRHEGRCTFHTRRQRDYDQQMIAYAREYLASRPDPDLFSFLRMNFAQLQQQYGAVTGIVVPRPKMVPLVGPYAAVASITSPRVST